MSKNWVQDIKDMHEKFEFHETTDKFDIEKFWQLMEFRYDFLYEELVREGRKAINEKDFEEIVDFLIDLSVVAIGTLDLMNVDAQKAWDRVHEANMSKKRGIKPGRPNPLGLPDLMKPEGWKAPSHEDNHGPFSKLEG
jgi:predicted HAD superfamily Cof-like phosphohydrolase